MLCRYLFENMWVGKIPAWKAEVAYHTLAEELLAAGRRRIGFPQLYRPEKLPML